MKIILASLAFWILGMVPCHSQGFLNLDFESAHLDGYAAGLVTTKVGIPGWTAYVSGYDAQQILYNTINLDEPAVTIQSTNYPFGSPIQGHYTVFIQGGTIYARGTNAGIAQTGQIPISAKSLIFLGGAANMQVTFSGQSLAYNSIGSTATYTIFGADISAFAGQIGVLQFNISHPGGATLDNIQFSNSPVPEPGSLALLVAGGLLVAWRRWRRQIAKIHGPLHDE